jgi:hypothetical protein
MRRFILAIALLVATVASCLAQTQPVPKGCVLRGRGMVAPAYLAVNDPCLGSAAAVGDGMIQPATYSMESGSANIYLTYTAQVLVTLSDSTSSDVLTISPCVARQEWNYSTGGVVYRVNVYGAGATSTITANAASSGTNIIHVASGGTSVPLYSPVTDTTTGANIPSGTYVTATTATNITLNQDVTVAPSDVVQYAATLYGQINGISAGGCTITINTPPTTAVLSNLQYLTVTPAPNACGTCTTTAVSAQWAQWRYDQCGIAANSKSLICPAGTFYSLRDVTQGTSLVSRAYLRSVVAIHDPTGTCADLYAQIISTDSGGDTATLDRAASCAITSSNFAAIYWGSALFATSYHGNLTISAQSGTTNVNTSIDVPGIGSGSVAGAPVDLVTTVSSVTDYLSATLAASASVATSPSPYGAYLRWGTDDTAATIAACTAAAAATNPGYHGCYWPSGINTFMASMSVAADRVDGLLQTTRCG